MHLKNTIQILQIIGFCTIISTVKCQQLLSENEAVKKALANSYAIKIGEKQINIAKNNNTRGNAGMLPTLTGNANKNFNVNNTKLRFFDEKLPIIDRRGVQNNTGLVGLGFNWTLFDGKGMFIAKDQLGKLQHQAGQQVQQTINNTVAQVLNSYYEVVRANRRVKNFKKGLEISADRMKLAKDRFEVGQGSKVDFLSAQVDYNQDKSDLINAEQFLENTKLTLNNIMVIGHDISYTTADSILIDNTLTIESLNSQMIANNPSLKIVRLNQNIAENSLKSTKAEQFPVIDLVSGYNYNITNNGAGAPQSTKRGEFLAFNYGLRASINIFDGFNQKRRIENAKINTEIAKLQEKDLDNQLNIMLDRSFQNYKNALELIKLEEENFKIAALNIEIAFERYRVGNSTSYELREVQRNAVAAETRLIEAVFTAKINEIELNRMAGNYVTIEK